jgi:hypothetical protein
MALCGLRMMPRFPSPSLRFRKAGFPRYGSKAGISGAAFPAHAGLPSPFVLSAANEKPPRCVGDRCAYQHLRASGPAALPQGPSLRSGLCCPGPSTLSGKAMARTGLRMMPTFPLPPLKFRTVSFPQSGFKAGLSDAAFPVPWFAIVLRALGCQRDSLLCVRDDALVSTSVRADLPLYPRGPRSGPGYAVPVHPHLRGPIRPTRGHIPTSPSRGL